MKLKLFFLFSFSFGFIFFAKAQNEPTTPIQLDRPDQTECPFITPKQYIQVENGLTREVSKFNTSSMLLPTSLWKYGVSDRFELRLITELTKIEPSPVGLAPITLGFKASICDEIGWRPQTAVICHFTTATLGSDHFRTSHAAPSFRFCMQHTLSQKLSLAYNIGAEWDGNNAGEIYLYTLTSGYSISSKIGAYAELYGYKARNEFADHRADAGITYLVNNNCMLDISGGLGLGASEMNNYFSFGASWRISTRKK